MMTKYYAAVSIPSLSGHFVGHVQFKFRVVKIVEFQSPRCRGTSSGSVNRQEVVVYIERFNPLVVGALRRAND